MAGHRDDPSGPAREPALNLPSVVVWLIAVLVLVQGARELLSTRDDILLVSWLAFVPARLTLVFAPERLEDIARSLAAGGVQDVAQRMQLIRLLLTDGGSQPWSLISYGLLHASWLHLISNAVWLAAFGSPVARRLGPGRFLVLMTLSTLGGALLHWWSRELEILPLVGASAAVAGATAAAIRFVFSPGVNFGGLGRDEVVRAIPAEPFGGLWRNPRVLIFVVIWFVTNLLFGAGVVPILGEETGIAWEAHIGGFVAGLLLFPLFDRGPVRR